ncbi:hypothetical protein Tco_0559307 [Tanacetum coccineum]
MVKRNTDEDSYASVFADSILNDEGADVDDTGSKIEPGSQKENPKRVSDDDEIEKEKEVEKDMKEKENEEVRKEQNIVEKEVANETNVETEKTNDVVKEKEALGNNKGRKSLYKIMDEFHDRECPANGGIVTIHGTILIPAECTAVITSSKEVPKEAEVRPKNFKIALHPNFPDQEVAIGGTLSTEGRTELCSLLKKNLDIFVWQPSDMIGVPRSVVEHRLNIREGYSPVRQKKRGQAPERLKAIQAEVQKLVEAGIMGEVYYYDWLSNPVMVKKHDGSWRMCVDFTDLNKACPQDCYPLPEINWKVESLCGYPFKCFLDAYKGYHQIQMAESDEEKTSFQTSQGVYCYQKCPSASRTLVPHTSDWWIKLLIAKLVGTWKYMLMN